MGQFIIPAGQASVASDDWQGIRVGSTDLVLPLQLFGSCIFPSGLFVVKICLSDFKVFITILSVCSVAFYQSSPYSSVYLSVVDQ